MKILLIEKDVESIKRLRWRLEAVHHTVLVALDGHTGLELTRIPDLDLIISEMQLRGLSGIHILQTIRRENRHVKFVFYSEEANLETRTRAVYAGANDFIDKANTKAADWPALLQRFSPSDAATSLCMAELELNPLTHTVYGAGQPIVLEVREYQLLEYLLQHPNKVLSRKQLFGAVWNNSVLPNEKMVTRYMNSLREKVSSAIGPHLIHTIVGGGYLLKNLS